MKHETYYGPFTIDMDSGAPTIGCPKCGDRFVTFYSDFTLEEAVSYADDHWYSCTAEGR
jgi:hypothetical protein